MKTFLTTIIAILLFTVTGRAQWSGGGTGTTAIYPTTLTNNFGLGTITPGLKAHIIGTLGFPVTTGSTQSGVLRLQGTGSNGVLDFSVNGSSGAALQATAQNDLSQTYPLALNPNGGNVGIGTTTPADLLTINSGANRKGLTFLSDGNASVYTDLVYSIATTTAIATGKPTAWIVSHRKDGYFSGTTTGESSLEFYATIKGGGYTAPLSFKSNGDVILASPQNSTSGNVGIGTIDTKGYKLAVNGSIIGTSVVVKTYATWPDFVFKPNYSLPLLSAIKAYIDLNHHLPEMPSAAEVAKNGQNLGEINALLLKKVEELTLYLINEHKANETLQTEVSELKSQMKLLVKELNIKKKNKS